MPRLVRPRMHADGPYPQESPGRKSPASPYVRKPRSQAAKDRRLKRDQADSQRKRMEAVIVNPRSQTDKDKRKERDQGDRKRKRLMVRAQYRKKQRTDETNFTETETETEGTATDDTTAADETTADETTADETTADETSTVDDTVADESDMDEIEDDINLLREDDSPNVSSAEDAYEEEEQQVEEDPQPPDEPVPSGPDPVRIVVKKFDTLAAQLVQGMYGHGTSDATINTMFSILRRNFIDVPNDMRSVIRKLTMGISFIREPTETDDFVYTGIRYCIANLFSEKTDMVTDSEELRPMELMFNTDG
jgi:hypothetical protein